MITLEPHQEKALPILRSRQFTLLNFEAGLGKTYTALAACYPHNTVGIIAPKSTLEQWQRSAKQMGITPMFVSTNSFQAVQKITDYPSILIIDEIHQQAGNTKFAKKVLDLIEMGAGSLHIWGLSASPIRDGKILNAWLIYAIISRIHGRYPTYWQFSRKYGLFDNNTGFYLGNNPHQESLFYNVVNEFMITVTYEDIGKSQDVQYQYLITPYQGDFVKETFDKFEYRSVTDNEFALDEDFDEYEEDEFNFLTFLGFIRRELMLHAVPLTFNKIKDGNGEKVIVFADYISPLLELEKLLKREKISVVVVTGQTKHRDKKFSDFKDGEIQVLLTTYGVTATGVDFPKVNKTIFMGLPLQATQLHQSVMRTVRLTSTTPIHEKEFIIISQGTVIDQWNLALLAAKIHSLKKFVTMPVFKTMPDAELTRKQAIAYLQNELDNARHFS